MPAQVRETRQEEIDQPPASCAEPPPSATVKSLTDEIAGRRRAEEQLNKARLRLERSLKFNEALLSAVPIPVFYKDADGRYLGCNRAFSELMGVTADQLKGKTVGELWPGEYAEVYRSKDLDLIRNPTHQVYDFKIVDKDGVERPVIYVKDVFRDEKDQVAGIVGAFIDITERKRAETELRESEARFRAIFDSVNDAIFIHDLSTGEIIDVNRRMCEMYGCTREEALRIDVGALGSGEPGYTGRDALAWIKKAAEEGPQLFEWRTRHTSGRLFWVEVNMRRATLGSQDKLLVVVRDITERKLAEATFMSSRQMLANVLENFPGVVFWKDRNSVYLGCNRNFSSGAGLADPVMIVGRDDYDRELPWKDDAERYRVDDRQVMESGEPKLNIIEPLCQANGRMAWFDTNKIPLYDGDGKVIGVLGTSNDITERRQAELALEKAKEQAEYEKSQAEIYLDLMGHDINNMHQICMGYLELALASPDVGPGPREMIATSLKAINSSTKLIENVKKLRRMKEGGLKHHVIDVGKLLNEMLPRYSYASSRDVIINYTAGGDSRVLANDLLEDVFSNIIGNAIKHSAGPVVINICLDGVEKDGKNWCRVGIEDNGPGITGAMKEKLFTRFRKAGVKPDGSGLGLYLVKALVDDFGGTIRVEDRVPGDHTQGSRFVLQLPSVGN